MMVIPPVAGVVVVEVIAATQVFGHSLGQLAQHFLRNTQGNAHHQQLIPQNQIAGDGLLQTRKVLEPVLKRLAARRNLGALRRIASERAAQDKAHDYDGDRDHSGTDVSVREVGIEQRTQDAKDNDEAENQAEHHRDRAVGGDELALLQLALDRVLIVLELVANGHGTLVGVVLQLAKRARADAVLVRLNAGKEDLENSTIDAILLGGLPAFVGYRDAIRLFLFFATEQALLLGLGRFLELDHAVVGQLHKRGDICLVGHIVPGHKGRKHRGVVGRGHIAEVVVLKERLGLGLAQFEHHDHTGIGRRYDNARRSEHARNRTRVLATGICLLGPLFFFA